MAVIDAVFGAFLLSLSAVSGIVGLTAGFVGIRMAGQGALGLTATTATALWFTRRRGDLHPAHGDPAGSRPQRPSTRSACCPSRASAR